MEATILIAAPIAVWFVICLAKMIRNLKAGKCSCSCGDDCSRCGHRKQE